MLDLAAKLNNVLLRCKFPEFVKVNALLTIVLLALIGMQINSSGLGVSTAALSIALLGFALVMIKLVDLLLNTARGLAIAVIGFAVFYASAPLLLYPSIASAMAGQCASNSVRLWVQGTNASGTAIAVICGQRIWLPFLLFHSAAGGHDPDPSRSADTRNQGHWICRRRPPGRSPPLPRHLKGGTTS